MYVNYLFEGRVDLKVMQLVNWLLGAPSPVIWQDLTPQDRANAMSVYLIIQGTRNLGGDINATQQGELNN